MGRRGFDLFRRFRRARDGAVAVEFALVVIPLCFMMFAIIEIGLYFTVDTVLDNAVIDTSRLIRTNQTADVNMTTAEQFKTRVCSRMSVFASDCPNRLKVDVQVIPQFSSPPADPLADGVLEDGETGRYSPGTYRSLVVVRAWYAQPLVTTFLAKGLSRMKDGTILLTATTAFRNEPA